MRRGEYGVTLSYTDGTIPLTTTDQMNGDYQLTVSNLLRLTP